MHLGIEERRRHRPSISFSGHGHTARERGNRKTAEVVVVGSVLHKLAIAQNKHEVAVVEMEGAGKLRFSNASQATRRQSSRRRLDSDDGGARAGTAAAAVVAKAEAWLRT